MFTGSDGGIGGGNWGPERPSRGKKIHKQPSLRQLVIFVILFIALFILMLGALYVWETNMKARAQPQDVVETAMARMAALTAAPRFLIASLCPLCPLW